MRSLTDCVNYNGFFFFLFFQLNLVARYIFIFILIIGTFVHVSFCFMYDNFFVMQNYSSDYHNLIWMHVFKGGGYKT